MVRRTLFVSPGCWLLTAVPLYAEVMDKGPTVADNWMWAAFGGLIAYAGWRWRWWVGAVVSTFAIAGIWLMYQEISDPFIGPSIRAEGGQRYVTHFYWSSGVGLALQTFSAYAGFRRRRARSRPSPNR